MVASKKSGSQRGKEKAVASAKKATAKSSESVKPSDVLTIDRRMNQDRRSNGEGRTQSLPPAAEHRVLERRAKVSRRRQIDPTTCERDYTPEEVEFMGAMDTYKRRNGRMFPTCSEVLEVIKALGYEKRPVTANAALPTVAMSVASSTAALVIG
jgi:hypothetical protein